MHTMLRPLWAVAIAVAAVGLFSFGGSVQTESTPEDVGLLDAFLVLGQPNFSTDGAGVSAVKMNSPVDTYFDGIRYYVADANNNRVLIYNSYDDILGNTPSRVLGQDDMTSNAGNETELSSSTLHTPTGVFSDGINIYVADNGNHRVLIYDYDVQTGGGAHTVLGQAAMKFRFANRAGAAAANTLSSPVDVAVHDGRLFVADENNNRVLIWDDITPDTDGAPADDVIGQIDMTSVAANRGGTPHKGTLAGPARIASHPDGGLFVVDRGNNRVLKYNDSVSTGGNATVVLGQATMNANSPNRGGSPDADTLDFPSGIDINNDGEIALSDFNNDRVLLWRSDSIANGAKADYVIGQESFTEVSPVYIVSAETFKEPYAVAWLSNSFFTIPTSNRVLVYSLLPTASAASITEDEIYEVGGRTLTFETTVFGPLRDAGTDLIVKYSVDGGSFEDMEIASATYSPTGGAEVISDGRIANLDVVDGDSVTVTFVWRPETQLTAGDYNLRVRVCAEDTMIELEDCSTQTSYTLDMKAPNAPAISAAAASTSVIDLSITSAMESDHYYEIYRDGSIITTLVGDDDNTYSDTGLAADTSYEYYVIAVDAAGNESEESTHMTVRTLAEGGDPIDTPDAPEISVAQASPTSIRVSWSKEPTTGYRLYRVGAADGDPIYTYGELSAAGGSLEITDTGLTTGNTYTYYAEAFDIRGVTSEESDRVSLTLSADGGGGGVETPPTETPPLPAGCPDLSEGDLFKIPGNSAVYYINADGERSFFPNAGVFFSRYESFGSVTIDEIDATCVDSYPAADFGLGYRAGAALVKTPISPTIYAILPNGVIRALGSGDVAAALYGPSWASKVVDLPDVFLSSYVVGAPITDASQIHEGQLVNDGGTIYFYYDGRLRQVTGDTATIAGDARSFARSMWEDIPTGTSVTESFVTQVRDRTTASHVVPALPAECPALGEGDLFQISGDRAVYYVDADGYRKYFPTAQTFLSRYTSFSDVSITTMAPICSDSYPVSDFGVTFRPGSYLVKTALSPTVYAVGPNRVLHKLGSAAVAEALYGSDWGTKIVDLADVFFTPFTIGEELTSADSIHEGQLVQDGSDVYYYEDGRLYPLSGAPDVAGEGPRTFTRSMWDGITRGALSSPTRATRIR